MNTKTVIGYQVADCSGENIQGDDGDPSGFASYEILSRARIQAVIDANPGFSLQPFPIHEGDIEEPEFLD